MVQHYERSAKQGQPASFHGWKHDSQLGGEYVDVEFSTKDKKVIRRDGGFVKHAPEVIEVPNSVEYRRALVDLSLWPADQATAQAAGVPFDPFFGGEEDVAHHAPKIAAKAEVTYRPAPPVPEHIDAAFDAEKV